MDELGLTSCAHASCSRLQPEPSTCTEIESEPIFRADGGQVSLLFDNRRYGGLEAAVALAELYRSLRLSVNFFQPSFKLKETTRYGAKVTKRYHPPATPHQRLISDPRTTAATCERVAAIYATLDPVQLLNAIRSGRRLVEIADRPASGELLMPTAPTLEELLAGLRTAWREGEVRPTSKCKEKAKRSTSSGSAGGSDGAIA